MTHHGSRMALVVVLASVAGAVAGPPAARADVTGISPSSATVEPGGGAGATVRIRSEAVSCLTVRSSSSAVGAEVSPNCGAGDWASTLTVRTSAGTPPGTYTIRVVDSEGGEPRGANFTLRVREPEPATTSTTASTTTARPTTTTRATTTLPPTTTEPAPPPPPEEPAPAEPPTTTEVAVREVPERAFVSVEGLIEAGVPEAGIFLPLEDPVFRTCLPMTSSCGTPAAGLVLVPARSSSILWRAEAPQALPFDEVVLAGVEDLQPAGARPENPGGLRYVLPILDLSTGASRPGALIRSIDGDGRLVAPAPADPAPAEAGAALPVVDGPFASTPAPADDGAEVPAAIRFGRPIAMRSQQFSEAAPVLVVSPGGGGEVFYGLRPAPEWEIRSRLVPFFTGTSLPYLVGRIEGPPGLFFAAAEGLGSPEEESAPESAVAGGDGATARLRLLAVAVAVAVGLIAAAGWTRRRRSGDGGGQGGLSTPL